MNNDKKEFLEIVWKEDNTSEKMKKFDANEYYAYVKKLSTGGFFTIEKPRIKKNFCFGYGYCGTTSIEEMDNAGKQAEIARTSNKFFIKENLKGLEQAIKTLEYHLIIPWEESEKFYNDNKEYIRYKDKVSTAYLVNYYKYPRQILEYLNLAELNIDKKVFIKEATLQDLQEILDLYKQVKQDFIKRLDTYLKKYGLKHIHSWSYLVD